MGPWLGLPKIIPKRTLLEALFIGPYGPHKEGSPQREAVQSTKREIWSNIGPKKVALYDALQGIMGPIVRAAPTFNFPLVSISRSLAVLEPRRTI